jgi:hypothetical protein
MRCRLYGGFLVAVFLVATALPLGAGPKKEPWMKEVGSAKAAAPPIDRKLDPGGILRVKNREGMALEIFIGSGGRIYAFKDGEPVVHVDNGMGTYRVFVTALEADEIVLYDEGGRGATARVKEEEVTERVLRAGERVNVTGITQGEELFGRFVNLASGSSTFVYTFLDGGSALPENEIGPESFRTTTLETRGEVKEIEWRGIGDTLVVEVRAGELQVKAGQPFE